MQERSGDKIAHQPSDLVPIMVLILHLSVCLFFVITWFMLSGLRHDLHAVHNIVSTTTTSVGR